MAKLIGEELIKRRVADEMLASDTHFELNQVVAILDILDKVKIPEIYEALLHIHEITHDPNIENYITQLLSELESK